MFCLFSNHQSGVTLSRGVLNVQLRWLWTKVFLLLCLQTATAGVLQQKGLCFFNAGNSLIQYTGRIDFSNPSLPRFWQPGVYINLSFEGNYCAVILQDEVLYGNKHNYIEIVLDGKPKRLQLTKAIDTIIVAEHAGKGRHELQLVKNTEANIGYLELVGVLCKKLLPSLSKPAKKIEFIGNSITCGASADLSSMPCGKGVWEDQHNAYLSYGATTARNLNAQYHLSSVSGIGLMHSCCNLDIDMPQVYDKISMRNNEIIWDFDRFQPDVITICLGQNDGIQDRSELIFRYKSFVKQVRQFNSNAAIVLLSSPMADEHLHAFMHDVIPAVVKDLQQENFEHISWYLFSKRYFHGCDTHPDVEEHRQIAAELTAYLKDLLHW